MFREMRPATRVILSCEHGGNDVPDAHARLFQGAGAILGTHRGYDIGSLGVGLRMACLLAAPLYATSVTRLLVEVNRSIGHDNLFSEFTRDLPAKAQAEILDAYYHPHRDSVRAGIDAAVAAGHRVVHIGVHSFTDVLDGRERAFDVGFLFDPGRPGELELSNAWRAAMADTDWRVRFNEPYLGTDDGLVTSLRTMYDPRVYVGLELEVRQGLIVEPTGQNRLGTELAATLRRALPSDPGTS